MSGESDTESRMVADTLRIRTTESISLLIHQFGGLVKLVRYNCEAASAVGKPVDEPWAALNALLSCHAALEALILETAHFAQPILYADEKWRKRGLVSKFKSYATACGRTDVEVPAFVADIAELRRAVTHSEPDNMRGGQVGNSIARRDFDRYVSELQRVAEWVWGEKCPRQHQGVFSRMERESQ